MKVLSWNVRGLGSLRKQRLLKKKIMQEKPNLVFLQETKCTNQKLDELAKRLGRQLEYLAVEGNGMSGGLATFWTPKSLHLLNAEATKTFLALEMQVIGEKRTLLFTNVYSPQRQENKMMLLSNLTKLHQRHFNSSAIYGGDFNMITSLNEKKGGTRALGNDALAFNSFIPDVNLVDVQPRTGNFTWNNRRRGDMIIASRLDRFLISERILLEGNIINSNILPSGGLDH